MSKVSERLKYEVSKSKYSARELATITDIPKSAMQRYISGTTSRIPLTRLRQIDIFVNSIYLYDDHFTICYHTGEKQDVMSYATATEAESALSCSEFSSFVPPNDGSPNIFEVRIICGFFIMRVPLSV